MKIARYIFKLIIYYLIFLIPKRVKLIIYRAMEDEKNNKKIHKKNLLVSIKIEDIKFKLFLKNERDLIFTYDTLFQKGIIYEETMIFCLKSIVKHSKNPVFLDVGAHMGYYCAYFSTLTNNQYSNFAIDSNNDYSKTISQTIKINNFKKMFSINAALSDRVEELFVHLKAVSSSQKQTNNHLLKYQKILNSKTKIKSITLDKLCENKNIVPTIIKMDVHGSEGKVLLGAKNILINHTDFLLLELHPEGYLELFSNGMRRKEIIEFLMRCNFNLYIVSPFRYNLDDYDLEYKNFKKSKKLEYLLLKKEHLDIILFDRLNIEIFILGIKKPIEINEIDCFI